MPHWDKGNRPFHSGYWANLGLIGPCLSVHLPQFNPSATFLPFHHHISGITLSHFEFLNQSSPSLHGFLYKSLYLRYSSIHGQLFPFYQVALHLHSDSQASLNILDGHAIPGLSGARKEVLGISLNFLYLKSYKTLSKLWTDFQSQGHMTQQTS